MEAWDATRNQPAVGLGRQQPSRVRLACRQFERWRCAPWSGRGTWHTVRVPSRRPHRSERFGLDPEWALTGREPRPTARLPSPQRSCGAGGSFEAAIRRAPLIWPRSQHRGPHTRMPEALENTPAPASGARTSLHQGKGGRLEGAVVACVWAVDRWASCSPIPHTLPRSAALPDRPPSQGRDRKSVV